MIRLIIKIIVGILGLWVATKFVPNASISGGIKIFIYAGAIWGLLSFFVGPLLKNLTLPLRIITLGLFGFLIDLLLVWAIDIFFPEVVIVGIVPLFWTTLILWGLSVIVSVLFLKK